VVPGDGVEPPTRGFSVPQYEALLFAMPLAKPCLARPFSFCPDVYIAEFFSAG
jgi:hypothetical protein